MLVMCVGGKEAIYVYTIIIVTVNKLGGKKYI